VILSFNREFFIKKRKLQIVLAPSFFIRDFFEKIAIFSVKIAEGQGSVILKGKKWICFISFGQQSVQRAVETWSVGEAWRFCHFGAKSTAWRRKSKSVLRRRPIISIKTVWAPMFFVFIVLKLCFCFFQCFLLGLEWGFWHLSNVIFFIFLVGFGMWFLKLYVILLVFVQYK